MNLWIFPLLLSSIFSQVSCNFLTDYFSTYLQKSKKDETGIIPLSYDIQYQLPLSEPTDPSTPIFTAHAVIQFDLLEEIKVATPIIKEDHVKGAQFSFAIENLDLFENLSLVYNGAEVKISNVHVTATELQVTVAQPVLHVGHYTFSIGKYKGSIGTAIYYRDAGKHAVFGSSFIHSGAAFPTLHSRTQKVIFSISIIHPIDYQPLASSIEESSQVIDENWQYTVFRTSSPIVPTMLSLAILPPEYSSIHNTYTGIKISVYFNKLRIQASEARKLLGTATQIMKTLKYFFSSILAMPKMDFVIMNDAEHSESFGTIIIDEKKYLTSDYENQIHLLTMAIARHWIGGLISIDEESNLCLQEDLLAYISYKVVRRITNDENIRLAHYAKIALTESLFEPGFSLQLTKPLLDNSKVLNKCTLKGVTMLESLEFIIGEVKMMKAINLMIYHSPKGSIGLEVLDKFLNLTIDDNIRPEMLLHFWRNHGGIPNIQVDRYQNSIKIRQLLDNITVEKEAGSYGKMTVWPLVLDFSEFQLPVNVMLSQGIHLAPVREGLVMANLGFGHFYRVNYDTITWKVILEKVRRNATHYTPRERSQLITDFCYFYSAGAIDEPYGTILRDEWLQLIHQQPKYFPLCEISALRCLLAENSRPFTEEKANKIRKQIFNSLSSSINMSCGKGEIHDAINQLCIDLYDRKCF